MKACVVQELSGPSGLAYTDVDDVAGNDDTLIVDVRAAGVCFPDLLLSKGEYQLKLPPPFIPGMEAAGVVHWAPEESEFKVGDRVSAFGVLGGYAEKVIAPLANVTRSPAELDDAEAVSLLVNYNTMYFALARRAAMRPGDTIGGPTCDDAIRVLAIDGKLLVIGRVGVAWGEYLNQVPGSAALFSTSLGQLVSLGLKPPAPQRYPLSEAHEALQCLADGGVLGKLVLEP